LNSPWLVFTPDITKVKWCTLPVQSVLVELVVVVVVVVEPAVTDVTAHVVLPAAELWLQMESARAPPLRAFSTSAAVMLLSTPAIPEMVTLLLLVVELFPGVELFTLDNLLEELLEAPVHVTFVTQFAEVFNTDPTDVCTTDSKLGSLVLTPVISKLKG